MIYCVSINVKKFHSTVLKQIYFYFYHLKVGDVFRTLLGVNVSLISKDIALRLKDTDIVVSTPQALSTYPYGVFNETETIVVDEADIQIDKRIGKHGHKDPLFKFMNYMLHQASTENRQINTDKRQTEQRQLNAEHRQFSQVRENSKIALSPENRQSDNNTNYEQQRQFVFVGATMPDSEVKKSRKAMTYIRQWVPDAQMIRGSETHMMMSRLDIKNIEVEDGNKLKQLVKVVSEFEQENNSLKILVFVDTVKTAQKLFNELSVLPTSSYRDIMSSANPGGETFPEQLSYFQHKWQNDLGLVHRDVSREERLYALDHFNNSKQSILITTDVTARGLDFKDVDTVVQFDYAKNVTDMLHRVGRTARMGKQGRGKSGKIIHKFHDF